MSSFTKFNTDVELKIHNEASILLEKDHWVTTKEFIYYLGNESSDQFVIVPAGYLTDGASVPRMLWSLIPPWGKYGQAAVLHDYLCDYGKIIDKDKPVYITRKQIDEIFFEALEVLKVPKLTISLIKTGVNTYRKLTKPNVPNITSKKKELEVSIKEKLLKEGKL